MGSLNSSEIELLLIAAFLIEGMPRSAATENPVRDAAKSNPPAAEKSLRIVGLHDGCADYAELPVGPARLVSRRGLSGATRASLIAIHAARRSSARIASSALPTARTLLSGDRFTPSARTISTSVTPMKPNTLRR